MKKLEPPGILTPIDDRNALLYLGHLAAQTEISAPRAPREVQIALTWICAHVAAQGARLWTAHLEDIVVGKNPIGSWSLQARTSQLPSGRITIERHAMLQEDGRQIAALAHPFLEALPDRDPDKAIESILDFSIMTVAAWGEGSKKLPPITDMNGLKISIRVFPKRKFKFSATFLSNKNSAL